MSDAVPPPRRRRTAARSVLILLAVAGVACGVAAAVTYWPRSGHPNPFVRLCDPDPAVADTGFADIADGWSDDSPVMALETSVWLKHPGHRARLFALLREKTGQGFGDADTHDWYRWVWSRPPADPAALGRFRVALYDHAWCRDLADYFRDDPPMAIRADEIRHGGVGRDGIPPIRSPQMLPAADAGFLADTDKVYGVVVSGDARAYPRRILGHHEMVCDTVGGVPITGVYCTLCETMIAYRNRTADGQTHEFGTSGFLYRSNKLMYDRATLSLWSTIDGEPVVGRLVGRGLRLETDPVVTTTWGEWRAAHPGTRVLGLGGLPDPNPDFPTNYREGAAYQAYYATDRLMFPVPGRDDRLANKDEVFVPRPPGGAEPVAFAVEFLRGHPAHHADVGGMPIVVVTTPGGANRAYQANGRRFRAGAAPDRLADDAGGEWSVTEEALVSPAGERLPRVPGHRVFWFGWHAAHPDTKLVK